MNFELYLRFVGTEVLEKETSERELVHSGDSVMVSLECVVWLGGLVKVRLLEAFYKVFPTEMYIGGREIYDVGEFTPGPQLY